MTSPPADTSGVQEPVHSFGDLLHRWQKCIFTRQFCAITSAAAPSQKTVPSNNRVFLELLNDGKSEAARNTVADRPNAPKRLDGCELNSHKRGQTCVHSCPPTLPHPLYLSNLHLVTQHTIQGLLLVAWDELLHEWVAFYRGCPSVLSSAKGRDTDDELERSEHVWFFFGSFFLERGWWIYKRCHFMLQRLFNEETWGQQQQRSRDVKGHFSYQWY